MKTALERYARLECPGIWRPHPDAQRVEVVVSFGASSLVITDLAARPLAHWSLAAVARVGSPPPRRLFGGTAASHGASAALYTPSSEATELLEITDDTMIEAVETVRRAVARSRPRSGRVRSMAVVAPVVAALGLSVWWVPEALVRHAVAVLPEPARAELGVDVFAALGRVSAAPCHSPAGDRALVKLTARVGEGPREAGPERTPDPSATPLVSRAMPVMWASGDERVGPVVVPDGIEGVRLLPGGIVLIGRALVEDHESPDVLAGALVAAQVRAGLAPPLAEILREVGVVATVRLLTTGRLPQAALDRHAEALLVRPEATVPDEALLGAFEAAAIASTPYAYARDVTGETVLTLIEGDPMRNRAAPPLLASEEWAALQAICDPR